MGRKDLTRPNVPPGLWNAIETGFDSIISLEVKRNEDLSLVAAMENRLLDCEEASDFLISLQSASNDIQDTERKGTNATGKEAYEEGIEFDRQTFGIINSAKRPSMVDEKRPFDGEVETAKRVGSQRQEAMDCEGDAEVGSMCMVQMTGPRPVFHTPR